MMVRHRLGVRQHAQPDSQPFDRRQALRRDKKFRHVGKGAKPGGRQAVALDRVFAGLVAQGVALWMGFQAFINMGVNLGALPTKGLTLPLMSYGGSAILMNAVAIAVVLRIDYENRVLMRGGRA